MFELVPAEGGSDDGYASEYSGGGDARGYGGDDEFRTRPRVLVRGLGDGWRVKYRLKVRWD